MEKIHGSGAEAAAKWHGSATLVPKVHMYDVDLLQGVEAVGSYAENQKIAAIRKVYQRAVLTPMLNIEVIWKAGQLTMLLLLCLNLVLETDPDHAD